MLTHFRKLILSLALVAMAITAQAQKRTPFFVQISDPQLGFISKNKNVEKERELMEKIIPALGHEPRLVTLKNPEA